MKIKSISDIQSVVNYLRRIGAEERSMRTAVVKEQHGNYWHDVAVIKFLKDGTIDAPNEYSPTSFEQQAIADEFRNVQWPEHKTLERLVNLPEEIKTAGDENVFEFRGLDGRITMLQVRVGKRDGGKAYVPWTYWDDGQWRKMEPEGKLPLWGLEQLNEHQVVFIHEGAKAARTMREMVEGKTFEARKKLADHPWGEEMSGAAHLGWIGGALSPYRTDWSVLQAKGVTRAYIVSDNDSPGRSAVPAIAFHLRCPTFHIQFTNEWPSGFDLADEFPESMFREIEGKRYYIGPSFRGCLHPATWATDEIQNAQGKPTKVLRKHFADIWAYVEDADLYCCIEMPSIVRTEKVLNNMLAAFSHTMRTSDMIQKAFSGRSVKFCYRPDVKQRIVSNGLDDETTAINLHSPTNVKSKDGDPRVWLEFMEYMFPREEERREVLRWCATLIARPEVRMEYGLLLISETQGVGKTTLGSAILAPLVGRHNTSFPSEQTIVQSDFNGWLAHKRLVVVNEIYAGHSRAAYNKLKSSVTDTEINYNQKYQKSYTLENWAHIFACSNSTKALNLEHEDRRWLAPEVTEMKWSRDNFVRLHGWIQSGGLGIIKKWAEGFGDYVLPGQPAPMTNIKKEIIEDSMSEEEAKAREFAQVMNSKEHPLSISYGSVKAWLDREVRGRQYDTGSQLRAAMRSEGVFIVKDRLRINGSMQYVALNAAAKNELIKEMSATGVNVGAHKGVIQIGRHSDEDAAKFNEHLRKWLVEASVIVETSL